MRVVMIDDHPLERDMLGAALWLAGVEVAGGAGTAEEGLRLVEATAPDVVLLDLKLSDADDAAEDEGLRVAETLRAAHPDVGILVRSGHARAVYARRLLDLAGPRGAVGYLRKGSHGSIDDLVRAIREVADGGIHLDPVMVHKLVDRARPKDDPIGALTDKERAVLKLVARGMSNRKIAQELGSTRGTIDTDVSAVFAKLGITTGPTDERWQLNARVLAVLAYLRAGRRT